MGRRAHSVVDYRPVLEDWMFHVVLPASAYLTIGIAALASRVDADAALFAVAGATMLLLFVGIHNAWDSVTYIVAMRAEQPAERHRGRHR